MSKLFDLYNISTQQMNQSDLLSKNMSCLLASRYSCIGCQSCPSSISTITTGAVPAGGIIRQILTKNSSADYDMVWTNTNNLIVVNIYDNGTDFDCSSGSTNFTVPAFVGTSANLAASSFDINLNPTFYNSGNFPLYSVNCLYLTSAGIWRYTSVRVGNVTGSILSSIDSGVTTISFSGIARANLVSPATASGVNLKLFIQILN